LGLGQSSFLISYSQSPRQSCLVDFQTGGGGPVIVVIVVIVVIDLVL
jgi:hypothetical protein